MNPTIIRRSDMEFLKNSNWIWSLNWDSNDKEQARIVLFRKKINIAEKPVSGMVSISADSRYKLYVNDRLAQTGPSKGDKQIWFYDNVDISNYLKKGINIIAVEVLRYPQALSSGSHSTFRTETPGLYVVGNVEDEKGNRYDLQTDESWKCKIDESIVLEAEEEGFAPLWIHERVKGNKKIFGWKRESFCDSAWDLAKPYVRLQVPKAVSPGNLNPRTIPFMYRKKRQFNGIIDIKKSRYSKSEWNEFLKGRREIVIPPNSEEIVEIDAGEEMTGYLRIALTGGAKARAELLQSEAYVLDGLCKPAQVPAKGDRIDTVNGHLTGYTDVYEAAGLGTDEEYEVYEPFWFRTFRFIQLKITTAEEALNLKLFDYEETGYPLEIKTNVNTSDESLKKIWDISERTLRRCMHETYMDCPFYEQLQYAMDSRLQILYTYSIAADDRLARKCIDDFKRAQRYDGLLNCCYPNCNTNVIPGFSIYYILMLYDHMMYFGDKKLIEYHMPAVENILNFFDRNIVREGYVGKIGGLNLEAPFWSFIDWAEEWNPTTGMPPAGLKGPLTMESLLYVMGLQHAAKLAVYIERHKASEEYLKRAGKVQEAIRAYCMGADGMLKDGPGIDEYSQHCQVFSILTDTVDLEAGRKNLLETVNNTAYTQCTVAMRYYLFRALEKTGLYEYTNQYWDSWREMLKNNCTTCVEAEAYSRSECHAWGALALYELPGAVLGVRPAEPGYKKICIEPVSGYLKHADGRVKTPVGEVYVSWKLENGELKAEYKAPEGIEVVFRNSKENLKLTSK